MQRNSFNYRVIAEARFIVTSISDKVEIWKPDPPVREKMGLPLQKLALVKACPRISEGLPLIKHRLAPQKWGRGKDDEED